MDTKKGLINIGLTKFGRAVAIAAVGATVLAGCAQTVNPATGQREMTALSRADEQRIGDQEHPKILKAFGGAYDDPTVARYVGQIGERLAANSELPGAKWTFTVLNSPVINAFALPGGYIYVTRGLVAHANDEAELASVIGHEIGHVTGRHTAQRVTRAQQANIFGVLASIGAAAAGIDPRAVGQAASVAGQGYVASYSREQEYEADQLGIRYIARAGYDPYAAPDFLSHLGKQNALSARISGSAYDPTRVDMFATHPPNEPRTRQATLEARRTGVPPNSGAPRRQQEFQRIVDGIVYGDAPEQGFVRGRTFSHPVLRFTFTVPDGFRVVNSSNAVVAVGRNNSQVVFDGGKNPGGSMTDYISRRWVPALAKSTRVGRLQGLQSIRVNGLPAATALLPVATSKGRSDARLVAIDFGDRVYRFTALYPENQRNRLSEPLRRMTYSFRRLSQQEANRLKPLRVRVVTVRRGDTVGRLANRMAFDSFREERFRVLNGLDQNEQLRAGQRVKIVTER
ncbi:MAG: M48 family metalloprotease [Pseudomonadota bacterium]